MCIYDLFDISNHIKLYIHIESVYYLEIIIQKVHTSSKIKFAFYPKGNKILLVNVSCLPPLNKTERAIPLSCEKRKTDSACGSAYL